MVTGVTYAGKAGDVRACSWYVVPRRGSSSLDSVGPRLLALEGGGLRW